MSVPVREGDLGPQVNKYEQVSSDYHQMSGGGRYSGLMTGGRGGTP